MQTQPGGSQFGAARARLSATTFYTLLCFSLAGLLTGFAFGGFASHLLRGSSANLDAPGSSAPTLTRRSPASAQTQAPENIFIGQPAIASTDYTSAAIADGTTSYQFAAQIVNKADQTPLTATDVVCRLWLTNDLQATTAGLSANNYALPKNPSLFKQPFPSEVQDALAFTGPNIQTQTCATSGKTRWTYTLATALQSGTYYLAVLADWKGIHYNWYMVAVTIRNQNKPDAQSSKSP
ncbi:MAG TPA: hypothetical protein VGD98_09305 [Ktedonobacteraceae bacterium]